MKTFLIPFTNVSNHKSKGDKMNLEEKSSKIEEILRKNIPTIDKIIKLKEHQSITFCLLIENRAIGIDIQNSLINDKTIQEIETYFSDRNIYHSIFGNGKHKLSDHEGVFIFVDDKICQKRLL